MDTLLIFVFRLQFCAPDWVKYSLSVACASDTLRKFPPVLPATFVPVVTQCSMDGPVLAHMIIVEQGNYTNVTL